MVRTEFDEYSSDVQAREHMARNLIRYVKEISATRKTALGSRTAKARHARKLKGKYYIDLVDMELNKTMTYAGNKWELHSDFAMPCKSGKASIVSGAQGPAIRFLDEHG